MDFKIEYRSQYSASEEFLNGVIELAEQHDLTIQELYDSLMSVMEHVVKTSKLQF